LTSLDFNTLNFGLELSHIMDNEKTQIEFKSHLYYPPEYNVILFSKKIYNSCSIMNKGFIYIY